MAHEKSIRQYQTFHGQRPRKLGGLDFTMPRSLTYLGDAFAIEYESSKTLNGTAKRRLYRHKVGAGVKIYLHPDGKTLLIRGGKFRVTDWMRG